MTEQVQKNVLPDRSESPEELDSMAKSLEEIQMALEPVRDQALDRKAFFTGYSQCAEDMIKVIVAKMSYLRKQSESKKEKNRNEVIEQVEEKKQTKKGAKK